MDATLGNKSYIYHSGYGYSKKRCLSIATWFINKYLPRHKLMIDIDHRSLWKDDCYGYLDASNYSRPRSFTISLHVRMTLRGFNLNFILLDFRFDANSDVIRFLHF